MGALLGPVGGLVELHGNAQLQVATEARHTYKTYLSGRRQAQRLSRRRKVWSASIATATPQELALLKQMSALPHAEIGAGLVWYDELAQVSNILSEDVSLLLSGYWTSSTATVGGAGYTSDGVLFTRSVVGPVGNTITLGPSGKQALAVPPSRQVTVSVYGSTHPANTGTLTVTQLDAQGATVISHAATLAAGQAGKRVTRTFTTDSRTVSVRIVLSGFLMVALPAVTLTDRPLPWAVGLGSQSVAVDLDPEDVQGAVVTTGDWFRRSSISYTVTELG